MSGETLFSANLTERILFSPISQGADNLLILSSYATPSMASWLIKNLQERELGPIDISLMVGMTSYDGLSQSVHNSFKELHGKSFAKAVNKFICGYVYDGPPIHANVYIWLKREEPILAFCGSADFMQSSFLSSRIESMSACSPEEAYKFYSHAESKSIYCSHCELEEHVLIRPAHPVLDEENTDSHTLSGSGINQHVVLSFLTSRGDTGRTSGLNWGQREGRNKNEAYIPLSRQIAKMNFFPTNKQHFTALTDDGYNLILRVEQDRDKAITTPLSNARLGEYFRRRLGLADGAYVTKQDLLNYGRTDVTFFKIDDEAYYMDFLPHQNIKG